MSTQELDAVKKYIDEHLGKGFIQSSSSQAAAPCYWWRNQEEVFEYVLTMYRALNQMIKSRYPIPPIEETLGRLTKAKSFTELDIIHTFSRIRIKEGHECLTGFNTRYEQFKYLVMPFGLYNAPGTFQSLINDSVRGYLEVFPAHIWMISPSIYSENESQHVEQVREVLRRLLKN